MKFVQDTPQNKAFAYIVLWAAFIALITILGMFGSGCKSAEKKQAKMYGKFDKLKRKADADSVLKVVPPKWSLDNFPLTISKGKTIYIPSKPKIIHDTTTTTKVVNDTVYVTKYVTKHHYQTDTLITTDTILDNRPLTALQTDYRALNAKATQYKANEQNAKDKLNKRTGIMWWLIVAVVLLLLWTFRKMFGFLR
jgi:hypothetical protein